MLAAPTCVEIDKALDGGPSAATKVAAQRHYPASERSRTAPASSTAKSAVSATPYTPRACSRDTSPRATSRAPMPDRAGKDRRNAAARHGNPQAAAARDGGMRLGRQRLAGDQFDPASGTRLAAVPPCRPRGGKTTRS